METNDDDEFIPRVAVLQRLLLLYSSIRFEMLDAIRGRLLLPKL